MNKKSKVRISVVIPTYNSWTTLKDCIASIQKQTLTSIEILVVDNGSSDNTSDKVRKKFPKVKLITLKKNSGVTGGRNKGIEYSNKNTDFILFFDHDMVADKKMIEELVKTAHLGKSIGIVTPKIYYADDKKRIWAAGTGINLWTGQVLFRGGEDIGQFQNEEEVQVAPAVLLVKKEVIEKLQGFDDRYFATYEDTDFCFRASSYGWKVFYNPKWAITHLGGASSTREFPILSEYKNVKLFYKKHYPKWQYPILRFFLKIGALGRIVVLGTLRGKENAKIYAKAFSQA